MVEQTQQLTHDQMGCDGWEISAHANAAPDHEPIQGKQEYSRFSKAAGLRTQNERTQKYGFGRKQAEEAEKVAQGRKSKSPERYSDITREWYATATPDSHTVRDLRSYTVGDETYTVDGHNVVLDYSPHEKEIAELLEKEVGGEIYMVPRVNNPQGVSTPDYLFRKARFDLKSIRGCGKNTLYDAVAKRADQAENFIFDLTNCPLSGKEIERQTALLFTSMHTKFIDTMVLVKDGGIIKVLKRNKD